MTKHSMTTQPVVQGVAKPETALIATSDGIVPDNSCPEHDTRIRELRWNVCMKSISRCEAAPGIRESSIYSVKQRQTKTIQSECHSCMKPLIRELLSLSQTLPSELNSSIWIRFDEETPQFMRAMMTGPDNTPYAGGLFVFDMYVPNDYPVRSPYMTLLTTGRGSVRFGPNLYADGTVCLSLLGSWSGPQWNPLSSNLYQLLVSVQSLILGVEQPYYLEPGRGGWEGTVRSIYAKEGSSMIEVDQRRRGTVVKSLPWHVRRYNSYLMSATVRWAMLDHLRRCCERLEPFRDVIQAHFYCNSTAICDRLKEKYKVSTPWSARTVRLNKVKSTLLPELEACLASVEMHECLRGLDKEQLEKFHEKDVASRMHTKVSLEERIYTCQIPHGVAPGTFFIVSAGENMVKLCCPKDGVPGLRLYFRLYIDVGNNGKFSNHEMVLANTNPSDHSAAPTGSSSDGESPSLKQMSVQKHRLLFSKMRFPKQWNPLTNSSSAGA